MKQRTWEDLQFDMEQERRLGIAYLKRPTTRFFMRESFSRDFLDMMPWDKYMTLTFRPELETKDIFTCQRRFESFLRIVKKEFKCKKGFDYFVADERHQTGLLHMHALANGMSGISDTDLWQIWSVKYGRARVQTYDVGKGATHYLTKYVTKELCWWDIKIREERNLRIPGLW